MSTRSRRRRGEDGEERHEAPDPVPVEADREPPFAQDPQSGSPGEGGPSPTPEEIARERDRYLEMWQRAAADYQNLRRRGLADMEQAARQAKESLLHGLLRVLDYLDMALASECSTDEGKNLLVGVRMTRDELVTTLEREGVRAVPDGGPFDPRIHQAMATVETDEIEPGQVIGTVRRGYVLDDRPLRHAQVRVSAAPGEEPPSAPGEALLDTSDEPERRDP